MIREVGRQLLQPVPSQARPTVAPRRQLSGITDPCNLCLPEEQNIPDVRPSSQPWQAGNLQFIDDTDMVASTPVQLPQDGLPGFMFGADFQWDFNPISENAVGLWSQMPAHSWLDTTEGWDAMLRPDSPNPIEGDYSVDSRAVHYVARTASVTSEDLDEFIEENGRKYHRYHAVKYLMPNDAKEQDRLDLQHHTFGLLFHGELSHAPIGEPRRALDLATGTGIWAIQFAEKHPNTTVIGTDLSPIQPDSKPDNCRFWVQDDEDPWHFDLPFDYIHSRTVFSCFDNPKAVIQRAYDNLEPGGWLEYQDVDSITHCDDGTDATSAHCKLINLFTEGALCMGRDIRVAQHYKKWFQEIGFEEVTERKFKLPGNAWPKDPYAKKIGHFWATNAKDMIDACAKGVLRSGLDISPEEVMKLAERAKVDCSDPAVHWYVKV